MPVTALQTNARLLRAMVAGFLLCAMPAQVRVAFSCAVLTAHLLTAHMLTVCCFVTFFLARLRASQGGNSFSAFTNTRIEMKYETRDETHENKYTSRGTFGLNGGYTFDYKVLPGVVFAPLGLGYIKSLPNSQISITPKGQVSRTHTWSEWQKSGVHGDYHIKDNDHDSSHEEDNIQEGELTLSFTYTTSQDPDKAGPPSDAFLVPSVWFEVHQVWHVSAHVPTCTINGFMDVELVANADLAGFAFTTANDVETRNLPLLKDQADEATFRVCCAGYTQGVDCALEARTCCRPDDPACASAGVNDLPGYCKHRYGADQTAIDKCSKAEEDYRKSECKAFWAKNENKNQPCPSLDGSATSLDDYCTSKYESGTKVKACKDFVDIVGIVNAHDDWYDILDRNYLHHEKARDKSAVLYYNDRKYGKYGVGKGKDRYGARGTQQVPELNSRGMAPKHLIDLVTGFDNNRLTGAETKLMREWNDIGFEGGGSSVEFTQVLFACAPINALPLL